MALTQTLHLNWAGNGRTIDKSISESSTAQFSIDEDVSTGETDYEIACVLDVSEIKAIYIVSDQDITLETNDGSSPADTLSLVADEPYIWWDGCLLTNVLDTDITAIFITNASGSTARLRVECLYDSTP